MSEKKVEQKKGLLDLIRERDLWILGSLGGLILATLITYWPTLNFPFQFDDLMNITKNFAIRAYDVKLEFLRSARWIGELSNKFNFKLGHFQPWSYRFINLIIHCMAGVILFAITSIICREQKRGSFLRVWSRAIPFFTAALFLLHPVQSQTVNYAIQARLEGLASMFTLATLLVMLCWMTEKSKVASRIWLTLACFFGFLSCGTKEVVVVMPFLAMAIDWFFVSRMEWKNFKERLVGHLIFAAVVIATVGFYLGGGFVKEAVTLKSVAKNNRGNIVSHGVLNQINAFEYLISEFKVVLHYMAVFFMPHTMSVEYDWKLAKSIFQWDVILPLLALIAMAGAGLYFTWQKKQKEFCFSLFWFLMCLAPRCSLIPCPELVCDYKTYLASCGMFFAWAFVLTKLLSWISLDLQIRIPSRNVRAAGVFLACVVPLCLATRNRSWVWSSSERFWGDVVQKAPNKARANNNYAVALCESGKFAESLPYLKKAINLDPFYCDPLSNIAVAYSMLGKIDDGMEALKQAIKIHPNYAEAHNNVGAMLIGKGDLDQAEEYLVKAVEIRPHYGKAYLNLGRVYGKRGDNEKSYQFYKKATETDLDNVEGFSALGYECLRVEKYPEAVDALEKAVKLGAKSATLLMNLAGAYCNAGKEDQGEHIYEFLHKNNPKDQSIAYNLALCRQKKGKMEEAIKLLDVAKFDDDCPERCIALLSECIEKTQGIEKAEAMLDEFCKRDNVLDKHKKVANSEKIRVKFQEKLNKNGGVLTAKDLKEAFGPKEKDGSEQKA